MPFYLIFNGKIYHTLLDAPQNVQNWNKNPTPDQVLTLLNEDRVQGKYLIFPAKQQSYWIRTTHYWAGTMLKHITLIDSTLIPLTLFNVRHILGNDYRVEVFIELDTLHHQWTYEGNVERACKMCL